MIYHLKSCPPQNNSPTTSSFSRLLIENTWLKTNVGRCSEVMHGRKWWGIQILVRKRIDHLVQPLSLLLPGAFKSDPKKKNPNNDLLLFFPQKHTWSVILDNRSGFSIHYEKTSLPCLPLVHFWSRDFESF